MTRIFFSMNRKPKISLIIAFYKNFDNLSLIFKSLKNQTFKDFEVIVAEDDNNESTGNFIKKFSDYFKFPIKHVFQNEKIGFRKNKILNKAVMIANGEILVFIDGDIIVNKNFLKTYSKKVLPKVVCFGRRVMLDRKLSEKLLITQNLRLLSLFHILFSGSKQKKYCFYIPNFSKKRKNGLIGCNWGIRKDDLLALNGFDEDYVTAGVGEDVDIEWRIIAAGFKLLSVRYSALAFHLFHKRTYSLSDENVGYKLVEKKKKDNIIFCNNGIIKKIL